MKQHIVSIVFLAALLASCSSNEAEVQTAEPLVPITFSATKVNMTRAALASTYSIYLSAIWHAEAATDKDFCMMRCIPLAYQSTDEQNGVSTWVANGYYYPVGGRMDFAAFCSSTLTSDDLASKVVMQTGGSTPQMLTASNQLLASPGATFGRLQLNFGDALDGSDDVLFSRLVSCACPNNAALPLPFDHALSCIMFALKTTDAPTADRLQVHSIKVKGANVSGNMQVDYTEAQPATTPATYQSAVSWPTLTKLEDIYVPTAGSAVPVRPADVSIANAAPAVFGSPLYLPPQMFGDSKKLVLEITYSILNGEGAGTPSPAAPATYTHLVNINVVDPTKPAEQQQWEAGKKYTYSLTCTLNEISVDPSGAEIEDWQIGVSGDATLEDWNEEEIDD